jgi:catechol 2,3-dioxygenase
MTDLAVRDLAHLSHVELLTPKPEESIFYFQEILGMEVSGESGDSVYLRGFGDYERSTVKLTAAAQPGVGHLAYRTQSPEALERRVAALEAPAPAKARAKAAPRKRAPRPEA